MRNGTRRERKRTTWRIIVGAILIVLCGGLILAGSGVAKLLRTMHQPPVSQPVSATPSTPSTVPAQVVPSTRNPEKAVNVLLLGCDTRSPGDPGRSDTIILARLDPVRKKITLMSIPRDTRVNIPGHGYGKINATTNARVYRDGGISLLVRTIQRLMPGIKISSYVQVDFGGFVRIIDTLGGVTLDVQEHMRYKSDKYFFDLKPGVQHLDGHRALLYVRFRSDRIGDFGAWAGEEHGRVVRQKQLLRAVVAQTRRLRNPLRLPGILTSVASAVRTDMPSGEMLRLGLALRDVNEKDIVTVSFPGIPKWIGPTSYVIPYTGPLQQKVAPVFGAPPGNPARGN